MSNERSPRASCSMTIGTSDTSASLLLRRLGRVGRFAAGPAGQPVEDRAAREAPLLAEPPSRQLARRGERRELLLVKLEQLGQLRERQHLARLGRQERRAADGERGVVGL